MKIILILSGCICLSSCQTDKHIVDVNELDFKSMTFKKKIEYSFMNSEAATSVAIKEIELLKQGANPIQEEDLYSSFYDYISVLIAASKENDKALDYLFQHADLASWDDVNFQKDELLEDKLKNKLSGYFVESIGRSGNSKARSRLLTLRENINYYGRRDFVDYLSQAFFEQYLVRSMGPEVSIEMDFRSPMNRNRVHSLKNEMFSLMTYYLKNDSDGIEMKKWIKDYYQKQGNVNSE